MNKNKGNRLKVLVFLFVFAAGLALFSTSAHAMYIVGGYMNNVTGGGVGPAGANGADGANGTFAGILNTTQFFNVSTIWSINTSWLFSTGSGAWVNKSGDSMTGDLTIKTTGLNTILTVAGGGVNLNASLKFKESSLDRWSILFEGLQNDLHIWNDVYDYSMLEFGLVQERIYSHASFSVQSDAGVYPLGNSIFFANLSNNNVTLPKLSGVGNAYVCVNENGDLYRSGIACM